MQCGILTEAIVTGEVRMSCFLLFCFSRKSIFSKVITYLFLYQGQLDSFLKLKCVLTEHYYYVKDQIGNLLCSPFQVTKTMV